MSAPFNPGPGWRKLRLTEPIGEQEYVHYGVDGDDEGVFWVREDPVPSLPTEPYTVIRAWVEGSDEPRVYIRAEGGSWFRAGKTSTLRARVVRFEVLAEPRAVTAEAVLDRVRAEDETNRDFVDFDMIAREFGVTT